MRGGALGKVSGINIKSLMNHKNGIEYVIKTDRKNAGIDEGRGWEKDIIR